MFGAVDDLIVHVGVVHHVFDSVAAILQIAADDVEDQRRHGVTDMRIVVNRHPAYVHFHEVRFERLKFFCLAGERVIDF